jgi:hypothetical protein
MYFLLPTQLRRNTGRRSKIRKKPKEKNKKD